MIGVIPAHYNVLNRFQHLQQCSDQKRAIGRPSKTKWLSPDKFLDFVSEVATELDNKVKNHVGWLAFFYTDIHHHIVSMRFLCPNTGSLAYWRPFKGKTGIFGHSLFSPEKPDYLNGLNQLLIVTEDELSQLQIQMLCLRYGNAIGKKYGYLHACAVGDLYNADFTTLRRINSTPVICYVNDQNRVGFSLVNAAKQTMNVSAFTPTVSGSTLGDFIRSLGTNTEEVWRKTTNLIISRSLYPRHYSSLESEVLEIMGSGEKQFEQHREITRVILDDLLYKGNFYNNTIDGFYYSKTEKKLIAIYPDSQDLNLMLSQYGLNRSEKVHQFVSEELYVEALERGKQTDVYRLSYFDDKNDVLYLSNHDNHVYRIRPDGFELVDNGTDGILFLKDSKAQAFEIEEIKSSSNLLDHVIFSKINFGPSLLTPNEGRLIFSIWLHSLFFENYLPTKPIMAILGPNGSGKSITVRKVGMVIFGENFNVTPLPKDEKDFDSAITNSVLVGFDNADTRCTWLNNKLAIVATGASLKRRKYYTTNELVDFPVNCYLALTSRIPFFNTPDVAERLIILKMAKFTSKRREKRLLEEVNRNRNAIMSEIVMRLQMVLKALKDYKKNDGYHKFRMADFADFAVKIGRSLGKESTVQNILTKLVTEQKLFFMKNDALFPLLLEWVSQNPGREITAHLLLDELNRIAYKKGKQVNSNPHSLARYLTRSALKETFDISIRKGHAGFLYYTFHLK